MHIYVCIEKYIQKINPANQENVILIPRGIENSCLDAHIYFFEFFAKNQMCLQALNNNVRIVLLNFNLIFIP